MYILFYFLTAAAIVGLDQLVKHLVVQNIALNGIVKVIPGLIHLTHVHNTGAAFSMLSGQRWPLLVLTGVCILVVTGVLVRGKLAKTANWALAMVLGGAVGNLIDRAAQGYVVDMFEVEFMRFAVFNVADIFVVCGGILLCLWLLLTWKKPEEKTDAPGA